MSIQVGDLKDTILKKISIDEYEPKTGEAKDVVVLGFYLNENTPGQDLYNFISNSIYEIRDAEVSPNPNPDNYYMVFVEMDRNENVLENIKSIIKDVENVSGSLPWEASTHLTTESFPLDSEELEKYVILNPDYYMTKEEWESTVGAEDAMEESVTLEQNCGCGNDPCETLAFLKNTNLLDVKLNNNVLEMQDKNHTATLQFVKFGEAKQVMADIGITETALSPVDNTLKKFNSMLGEMKAVKIDEYVVIFNPADKNVLVTKQI